MGFGTVTEGARESGAPALSGVCDPPIPHTKVPPALSSYLLRSLDGGCGQARLPADRLVPELDTHLVSGPDMEIHFDDGSWVDTDGNPHGIDLVSQPDIAERLGVTTNTVHVWRQRYEFPTPEWTVGQSPLWRWEIIEEWARETGRL